VVLATLLGHRRQEEQVGSIAPILFMLLNRRQQEDQVSTIVPLLFMMATKYRQPVEEGIDPIFLASVLSGQNGK